MRKSIAISVLASVLLMAGSPMADKDKTASTEKLGNELAHALEKVTFASLALSALEKGDVDKAVQVLELHLKSGLGRADRLVSQLGQFDHSIPNLRDGVDRAARYLEATGQDPDTARRLLKRIDELGACCPSDSDR